MKYIRMIVVILFILSIGSYAGLRWYHEQNLDETAPVITCGEESIEVSVKDPEEKLLEGVTASDNKDGDLTGDIIVEGLGHFMKDGSRTITYAVCDSSNNTGRATSTVTYSDYTPPRFSISEALRFPAEQDMDILNYLKAEDCLDGDLTNRIRRTKGFLPSQPDAGTYRMGYQVSNSAGDVADIELTVEIYDPAEAHYLPFINLSRYTVYIKKGKLFNPYQYIEDVTIGSRTYEIETSSGETSAEKSAKTEGLFGDLSNKEKDDETIEALRYSDIYIDNPVKVKEPGTYTVTYTVTTQDGYTGNAALSVIVYE